MTALAERLKQRYFGSSPHPYTTLERQVERLLRPDHTLLDAGCGRTAPVLVKYRDKARRLIGVDLVDFDTSVTGMELFKTDLANIPIGNECVDVVMSRSVLEHLERPEEVYAEINRVLKPGGRFVFLTANSMDYASLIARMVPNRFHPWIVAKTEGREEIDVFPTQYKTNTKRAVRRYAGTGGFEIESFQYLGQYPSYFMFNGALFLAATAYEKVIGRFETLAPLRGWIFATLKKVGKPTTATKRAR
jgi:ubiquinone/menaquinone biosynthesis C-methylase UbiE